MGLRLFHFSDKPGIEVFTPRPSRTGEALVWAVEEKYAFKYLLPRDCPRVTFWPGEHTTEDDRWQLMGATDAGHVVAVEKGWIPEILACKLYRYVFDPSYFILQDACAGYYVSDKPQIPMECDLVEDVFSVLLACDIELRIMDELWTLRDMVLASSLEYSIIRFANAAPRRDL